MASLGVTSFQSVPVHHCDDAHAAVVRFASGFSFAYSGDCRPSKVCQRLCVQPVFVCAYFAWDQIPVCASLVPLSLSLSCVCVWGGRGSMHSLWLMCSLFTLSSLCLSLSLSVSLSLSLFLCLSLSVSLSLSLFLCLSVSLSLLSLLTVRYRFYSRLRGLRVGQRCLYTRPRLSDSWKVTLCARSTALLMRP